MPESIEKTRQFVKESFIKHPSFSFNDWTIMYNHALLVEKIALQISKDMECDKTIVSISSLLHDIGKTHEADEETLHKKHEDFNLLVSEKFLDSLGLPKKEIDMIKVLVSYKSKSAEMKIVEDADTLAFYADKKLYTAFLNWIRKRKDAKELAKKKLDKFSKLNFSVSKTIGKKWFEQMKKDYNI